MTHAGIAAVAGIAIAGLLSFGVAMGQEGDERLDGEPTAEFHFARLYYTNSSGSRRGGGWGRGGGSWQTDYADAEYHLMQGINRLTRVDGQPVTDGWEGRGGRIIQLDDDRVFDYPWLYAVEVGQWYLSDSEAALLREYLDRGGFLIVDD
ncbi:MAG: DUF4159 domain-containing protein, partial [Gammaproteobacteria bacterium]|nr:DUF4159 domain-containing protein [Gammaproteobacteria bacterium]